MSAEAVLRLSEAYLAGRCNRHRFEWLVATDSWDVLHRVDNIHAINHMTEDDLINSASGSLSASE
jgi:hypothetical protein